VFLSLKASVPGNAKEKQMRWQLTPKH